MNIHPLSKHNALLSLLLLIMLPVLCVADSDNERIQKTAGYRYILTAKQAPVTINTLQQWQLHIETVSGAVVANAKIRVGGGMPEHNHGLPTAPQVTKYLGNGDYLIEGIKFHMTGNWELRFDVTVDDHNETVVFTIQL